MSENKRNTVDLIDLNNLDKAKEQELFSAVRLRDEEVIGQLIKGGIPVLSEIAEEYASSEAGFKKLFEEGTSYLHEAILTFDSSSGKRFIDYLKGMLEEGMQYYYDNLGRFLPIDYRIVKLHDRYELALLELYPNSRDREDDKVHDEGYLADYLGVTLEELRNMKNEYSMCKVKALSQPVKLNKSLPDDYKDNDIDNKSPLVELIADPASENGAADYLDYLMGCLSQTERFVVCAREGVLSVRARTDGQIASELGMEENSIESIYQGAIEKIRRAGLHAD